VIAKVLDDPDEATAVGAAGRATALELSWQLNARLTLDVYERVLEDR
jgi:glycosyltransferase involved in cell wall biosynthesis